MGALSDELPRGAVLLVGTRLTMVDQVLTPLRAHSARPIIAMPRRDHLHQGHAWDQPVKIGLGQLPQNSAALSRHVRPVVRGHQAMGCDWRDLVDGLRSHLRSIRSKLPLTGRAQLCPECSDLLEHPQATDAFNF